MQPFLAAAAPAFGFALAGALCAPDEGGAPAHDGAAPRNHPCCTAAQFTGPAPPPAGDHNRQRIRSALGFTDPEQAERQMAG
jgi:hypothetical protein